MSRLSCALAVLAAAAPSQSPADRSAASTRFEGFPGVPAVPSPLLELRLGGHGSAARLELCGGIPGSPATIAVADSVAAPPVTGCGEFDADGRFAVAVDPSRLQAADLVCQGFAAAPQLDGSWMLQSSNGLRLAAATRADAGAAADFSLLRIELDDRRDGEVADQLLAGDFVGALGTALDSHGDALLAKLSGKLMVLVPGTPVQVGGSVAYSAKIARDQDEYLVSIGQEVAVLCGVKATANIGCEGGVALGADQIYRFGSPAEVARGLLGIALQQALPGVIEAARGENLAKVRELRARIAGLVARLEQLRSRRAFRLPAAERVLDDTLGLIVTAYRHLRRVGDVLDRAAGLLVDEAQFVRDHTDGSEIRLGSQGEISLKIGDRKCGDRIGAELGGKVNGGYLITVRLFQGYGEQPQRVEVLAGHAVAASFAAGVKAGSLVEQNERAFGRGFEIAQKTTRGVRTVFERRGDGFGAPRSTVVIKREFGLLNFGRETTIEFDAAELGAAGAAALTALLDGEPAQALTALLPVTAQLSVQDRLTLVLKPEFGLEHTALTAKVGLESSWADCGPLRRTELSLATAIERLLDVERTAAELRELVRQVAALPVP